MESADTTNLDEAAPLVPAASTTSEIEQRILDTTSIFNILAPGKVHCCHSVAPEPPPPDPEPDPPNLESLFLLYAEITNLLSVAMPSEVTSIYPVTISSPNTRPTITLDPTNPIHPTAPQHTFQRVLFDTGALTAASIISTKAYNKLIQAGTPLNSTKIDVPILPFAGASSKATMQTSLRVTIRDKQGLYHSANLKFFVLEMSSFDIIINNKACRSTFSAFFYSPANWNLIVNPFRTSPTDEDKLVEPNPDLYDSIHSCSDIESLLTLLDDDDDSETILAIPPTIPAYDIFTADQNSKLHQLVTIKYSSVFAFTNFGIKYPPVTITTKLSLPDEIKCSPRPIRRDIRDKVIQTLADYTAQKLHTPSTAVYASPLVPIIKPDSSVRLAIDYAITVNPYITSPSSPIPNTKELIFDLSAYKYFCELDLTKAFRQLVLNESSSNLLSYVTPIGQFRPLTLPYWSYITQ